VEGEGRAKTAENVGQYLKKGASVLVEGRLTQDRWEKDGKKFSRIKVVAESVQFLSRPNAAGDAAGTNAGVAQPGPSGDQEPPF